MKRLHATNLPGRLALLPCRVLLLLLAAWPAPALAQPSPAPSGLESRPFSPFRARQMAGSVSSQPARPAATMPGPPLPRHGPSGSFLPAWLAYAERAGLLQGHPTIPGGGPDAAGGLGPGPQPGSALIQPPQPTAGSTGSEQNVQAFARWLLSGVPKMEWLPGFPSPPGIFDSGGLPDEPRIALHDGPACIAALADAVSYQLAGSYQAAVLLSSVAARACPELEEAALLLGMQQLLAHQTRGALATLESSYARGRRAGDSLTLVGLWCLFLGDLHGGRENLEEALTREPSAWRARLALATHLLVTGKKEVALRTARKLATETRRLRCLQDFDLLDLNAPAAELLQTVVRAGLPRCVPCRRTVADVAAYEASRRQGLAAQGWWQQAIDLLAEIVEEHPDDADNRMALGKALNRTGAFQEMTEIYGEGLRRGDPRFEYMLGSTLLDREQPDLALPHLERAVTLEPHRADAWSMLGTAQRILGRPEAIASLRRAIKLEPGRMQDFNDLGLVLSAQGYHPEALDAYRRALAFDPRLRQARYGLGLTLRALGRDEEAEEELKLYQQQLDTLQQRLAEREKLSGLEQAALEGLDHLQADRLQQAQASFNLVLKEIPGHAIANLGMAGVLLARGKDGPAAPYLTRFLQASSQVNSFIRAADQRGEAP